MLQDQNVTAGKYYVNNARDTARKVLEVKNNTVIFITYHMDTGNCAGNPSYSMKQHFTQWADHEATQTEMANLQHRMMFSP